MANKNLYINTGKAIPLFLSLVVSSIMFLIPDSRSTAFFAFQTPVGTMALDKVFILLTFSVVALLCFSEKTFFNVSNTIKVFFLYVSWVFVSSLISLFANGYFQINNLFFLFVVNFMTFLIGYILSCRYINFKLYLRRAIIVFGLANSIFMLFQHYYNDPLLIADYLRGTGERGFYMDGVRISRVWGFQGEPLAAAATIMVAILFLFDSTFFREQKNKKIILLLKLVSLTSMFFALSYTYSRGSLLSLSIALLYYLFKKKIKLFTLKRVMLFTISVPFLILFLFLRGLSFESSTFERFGQLSHDASFFARWNIITDVWNISQSFGAKIILGLGTGASNGIRYLTGGALDNQYLNIYYENGLIAIILVVLLFIGALRKNADIVFKAAIVGIIFNMTTYEIFYYSSAGTMIWLLMGVVTSQTRAAVKSKVNIEDTDVNYISKKKKRKTKRKYRIVL